MTTLAYEHYGHSHLHILYNIYKCLSEYKCNGGKNYCSITVNHNIGMMMYIVHMMYICICICICICIILEISSLLSKNYPGSQCACVMDHMMVYMMYIVSQLTLKECILNSAPKSCELDPIPSKLLIECLDSILPSLTDLFNSSLASGIFPQCFKSALVTPVH